MKQREIEGSFLCPYRVCERSIQESDGSIFALVRRPGGEKFLFVSGNKKDAFQGEDGPNQGLLCPLTSKNATELAKVLTWLRPQPIGIKEPSFGFGDWLGLATPGHVCAVRGREIFPLFAQQSIRELERIERTPEEVMADAIWGLFQEGYTAGFGANADHRKTIEDVERTAKVGFTMFTCDPSD